MIFQMALSKKSLEINSQEYQVFREITLNNGLDIKGVPSWFPRADLSRTHSDLIAKSKNGMEYIFQDYFTNHHLPSIETENGLLFDGRLIDILAGPLANGEYSQSTSDNNLSIGEVSSITGTAKAKRLDGNEFNLSNGDPVFQGDTIEVSNSGTIGLTFLDKTTLSLSEGGRMVLDELIYDSSNGTGSMNLSMLEGVFSFTSGEIAKIGPDAMKLKTPVVTCGIRGTTVAGKAAVEGNENSFTLLQDADGGVGQISISNAGGVQVLGQVGATTSIASFNTPPPPPIILSTAQIQANYGTALNVLPPTPAVAPTPQEPPPPQEQQQEEVQEEATEEESDEALAEEVSEDVSEEEGGAEEGEEVAIEEGIEEELLESEESLPEEGPLAGDNVLAEEGGPLPEEEAPEGGDQQAAREAFDNSLAAGASPEQAMAEAAAATGGFDGPVPGGGPGIDSEPLGGSRSSPLLAGPTPGVPGSGTDPLGGSPFTSTFATGLDGPGLGSPLAGGPINAGKSMVVGPVFGIGSTFGPTSLDTMGGGLILGVDTFLPGVSDFYSSVETESMGSYFFDDPSLYDDFKNNNQQLASSEPILTGIVGTSSNDTLTGTNENDTIHGLDGDDIIDGGVGVDTLNGGLGNDTYIIDNANDVVNEESGEGTDTIQSSVTYELSNNIENLTLTGSSNINATGNELDNVIIGNSGTNELSGGLGNDIFYFNGTSSFGDTIKDFSVNDELRFNLTFDTPTTQYSVTRSHFYEHSGSSRLTYNSSSNGNELPYIFNFTKDTSSYLTKSFKSDVVSSIRYTKATSGNGTEQIFIVGNGTDSAIWLWDDTSQGYGVGNSELTFIAELENFDNDTLSSSNIVLSTL